MLSKHPIITSFQHCAGDFSQHIKTKEKENLKKGHKILKIGKEETKLTLFMVNINVYVEMQNNYKN